MSGLRELDLRAARQYADDYNAYLEEQKQPAWPECWDMTDAMTSGLSGAALARCLGYHFPNTPRADVYMHVGAAIALLQADLTLAEIECKALRKALKAQGGGGA